MPPAGVFTEELKARAGEVARLLKLLSHRNRLLIACQIMDGEQSVSDIEAATGVSTGISAADRARTVSVAVAEGATGSDLVSPGHVFPLITAEGGVVHRPAAAEASIELCRRAGAGDAAVICSIMRDDGEMARIDDIGDLVAAHDLAVADISALIARLEAVEG